MQSVYLIVQRATRKQFVLSLAVAGLVLAAGCWNARYLANCFHPPVTLAPMEVTQVQQVNQLWRYYATIKGEETAETGITEEIKRDGEVHDTRVFLLMLVDRHLLLVRAEQRNAQDQQFTGALIPIPNDVQREVVTKIERRIPRMKGRILPFMLDAKTGFTDGGYWWVTISGIVLLICLWNLLLAVSRRHNPDSHPIMQALARFGPPAQVAAEIDAELREFSPMRGNVRFTRNWLIHSTSTSLGAMRLADIIWIYQQVTQHRVNFIPTGKSYAALIWDSRGICFTIPGDAEQVHSLLQAIAEHAPGVLVGYDKELAAHWNSHRSEVVATVMKRREEMGQQQVEAAVE